MNGAKYFGLAVIVLVWIWLVVYILMRTHITLLTLIWVAISSIVIFVPLYKKYFKKSDK